MNIIESLDEIVRTQLNLQTMRKESIKSKKADVIKYTSMAKREEERIVEIEKEIKDTSLQILEIVKIKKQLKKVVEPVEV